MGTTTSRDGTAIAFDGPGIGPAVIPIGGPTDRSANTPLVTLRAPHCTASSYDLPGRGDSGATGFRSGLRSVRKPGPARTMRSRSCSTPRRARWLCRRASGRRSTTMRRRGSVSMACPTALSDAMSSGSRRPRRATRQRRIATAVQALREGRIWSAVALAGKRPCRPVGSRCRARCARTLTLPPGARRCAGEESPRMSGSRGPYGNGQSSRITKTMSNDAHRREPCPVGRGTRPCKEARR